MDVYVYFLKRNEGVNGYLWLFLKEIFFKKYLYQIGFKFKIKVLQLWKGILSITSGIILV